MIESNIRKLPLKDILVASWQYCLDSWQRTSFFVAVAYFVSAMALFSWKSFFFWPILFLMYILWGMFFRYYLKRKPYFDFKAFFYSLVPSTKIVVLSVAIASVLIVLPIVPLFFNLSPEFNEGYARFLQGDFEQEGMLVLLADLVFILLSPLIVYRPFLAWISALAGRSGSLRLAWNKTRGNYKEFLLIAVITNFSVAILRWLILKFGANDYITLVVLAPVMVYFNVLSAKAYEFFFLDVE